MKMIPSHLSKFFWDTPLSQIDIDKNQGYIIARILHLGDTSALKWLNQTYDRKDIVVCINSSRELSDKDKNFFNLVY